MSDIRKAVQDMLWQLSENKWEGAVEPYYDYDTSGLAHEIGTLLLERNELRFRLDNALRVGNLTRAEWTGGRNKAADPPYGHSVRFVVDDA